MPTTSTPDHLKCHNTASDVTGWPAGQIRYFEFAETLTYEQGQAAFLALSPEDRLIQSSTSVPASVSGYHWVEVTSTGNGFDTSYTFSRTGTDFSGVSFVSTPAPILTSVARNIPRPGSNNYAFTPQSAKNTILSERFPPFSVDWLVVYAGPGFALASDRNPILSRGFNAVAENMPNRGLFSRSRLALLLPGGYDQANQVADALAAIDSNDARIPWLREWYDSGQDYPDGQPKHYLIDNQAAAQALGRRAWTDYQNIDWTNGSPLLAITPNFEVYEPSPRSSNGAEAQWRNMDGFFMQGVKAAALAAGQTPPALIMYDWASICHFSIVHKSRNQQASGVYTDLDPNVSYDPEVGVPFYFSYASLGDNFKGGTKAAPLNAGNVYSQYIKDNGGYAGSAEYMRNTFSNETHWQKNGDSSFKTRVVGGVTLLVSRTDAFRTTMNGEQVDILGAGFYSVGESDNFLYLTYERLQQAMVDTVVRAGGQHLPLSTARQTGWENLKLVQWNRHETEFKQPNEVTNPSGSGWATNPATGQPYVQGDLNHRPHNLHFLEGDVLGHCLLGRDAYRFWMEPQPELSAQGVSTSNNHSRASHEIAQKALQRLSQFNWIRSNVFRYLIPDYLIRNLARDRSWYDPNEEFEKKPILFGGLCAARSDASGNAYVWFYGRYPAQDIGMQTEVLYWWVDGSGNPLTGSYRFLLDGRETYVEDHQVPTAVGSLAPSRFRIQFTDMTGQKHTKTGSYLDAKITTHPTPPALATA